MVPKLSSGLALLKTKGILPLLLAFSLAVKKSYLLKFPKIFLNSFPVLTISSSKDLPEVSIAARLVQYLLSYSLLKSFPI